MLEKIAAMVAAKVAEKVGPWLVDQITKLIPVIVGAVIKGVTDHLTAYLPKLIPIDPAQVPAVAKEAVDRVIDADPDLPGLSSLFDLSELLKKGLFRQ